MMGDDGAGIYAVRRLAELLLARGAVPAPPEADARPALAPAEVTAVLLPGGRQVHLAEACASGLGLVETMVGYHDVVLIDAWPGLPPGQFTILSLADLDRAPVPASGHQIGLPAAMRAAVRLGLPVPRRVEVWAIGVREVSLGETCTPPVRAAVEEVAHHLADALSDRPGSS